MLGLVNVHGNSENKAKIKRGIDSVHFSSGMLVHELGVEFKYAAF